MMLAGPVLLLLYFITIWNRAKTRTCELFSKELIRLMSASIKPAKLELQIYQDGETQPQYNEECIQSQ
jgi:hypothetical protein